jgi:DNA-binding NtrC family response regulator
MPSPIRPAICSFGPDSQLLVLRSAVLEKAGFEVHTTTDWEGLLKCIEAGSTSLFLFCHQLSERDCLQAIDLIERGSPGSQILVMTFGKDNRKFSRPAFDSFGSPEALISALRGLAGAP